MRVRLNNFSLFSMSLRTLTLVAITSLTVCLVPLSVAQSATIETLKAQVNTSPDNLKLRLSLAKAYCAAENYEACIETLKAKAESLNEDGLILISEAYQKVNDPINERRFLEQLTTNYPKYVNGFVALGDFYFRQANQKSDPKIISACQSAYRSAIELNSFYRPAYDGLLRTYEKFQNFYELRILLGDMAKRFGRTPEIISSLCRRHTLDDYYSIARKYCKEAINLDPKNPENYVYMSLVENNQGEINKAEKLLRKVTEQFPDSEFAQSNFADFLTQQKNLIGAEKYFRQGAKADPKSLRAQLGLAQTSFDLKHYEPALEAYTQACTIYSPVTYRLLRKTVDLLRHRDEKRMEERYAQTLERCGSSGDDTQKRAPAMARDDYRSPFAMKSKYKLPDPIGF